MAASADERAPVPSPIARLLARPSWKSLMLRRRAYHSQVKTGGNGQTLFSMTER